MKQEKQDAMGEYVWAWLNYTYVKFVMWMRDMWVVRSMCEVVGLELLEGDC